MDEKDRTYVELLLRDGRFVTETSFGRLLSHIQSGESFALVSANIGYDASGRMPEANKPCFEAADIKRPQDLNEYNNRAYERLQRTVRSMGYGYVTGRGAYKAKGAERAIFEPSLFVPRMSRGDAEKILRKFCQESVLWGDWDDGIFLLFHDGGKRELARHVSQKTFADGWFEWKRYHPLRIAPAGAPEASPEGIPQESAVLRPKFFWADVVNPYNPENYPSGNSGWLAHLGGRKPDGPPGPASAFSAKYGSERVNEACRMIENGVSPDDAFQWLISNE